MAGPLVDVPNYVNPGLIRRWRAHQIGPVVARARAAPEWLGKILLEA